MKQFRLLLLTLMALPMLMHAQDPYAVLNDGTLTFYYDNNKSSRAGTKYDVDRYYNSEDVHFGLSDKYGLPAWNKDKASITKIEFDSSFYNYHPESTANWFYGLGNVTTIENISNLCTDETVCMGAMFFGCSKLTSLDLSSLNTNKVEGVGYAFMFADCTRLTTLNISSFNTSNTTVMTSMFRNCRALTSLDLSNFNTAKVTWMNNMFLYCKSLTSLDISNFNTDNVEHVVSMFSGCESLTSLNLGNFNTAKINDFYHMFGDCKLLKTIDVSNFNTANASSFNGMFWGCESLKAIDLSNFNTANATWLNAMFQNCKSLTTLDLSKFNTVNVDQMFNMFSGCSSLTVLDLSSFNTAKVKDMSKLFNGCSNLTAILVDDAKWSTAVVTNFNGMFSGCESLETIDVSKFNTANATDMNGMFSDCKSLALLDLSNFNTVKVKDMSNMFNGCSNMTTILVDETKWNTAAVTDGNDMFDKCTVLVGGNGTVYSPNHTDHVYARVDKPGQPGYLTDKNYYDLSIPYAILENGVLTFYFDSNKDTRSGKSYLVEKYYNSDMYWFNDANGQRDERYGLPGWHADKASVTKVDFDDSFSEYKPSNISNWFFECDKVTEFNRISNLSTENADGMACTFYGCSSLTSLDLSSFNTSNVTTMYYMFSTCSSLTALDVSNFNTDNVKTMGGMFRELKKVTTLDLSNFNTANVTSFVNMFSRSSSLTSINMSNFDTSKAKSMGSMFNGCSSLTSLDLRSFNTAKVTNMKWMFNGCSSLKTITVDDDKWSTASVTSGDETFKNCSVLVGGNGTTYSSANMGYTYARVDKPGQPGYLTGRGIVETDEEIAYAIFDNGTLTFYYDKKKYFRPGTNYNVDKYYGYPGWWQLPDYPDQPGWLADKNTRENIKKVVFDNSFSQYKPVSIAAWFVWCDKLTSIENITNLNTENVIYMACTFMNCKLLKSLDLSSFNTSKVTIMNSMFSGCEALSNVNISNFNTANVTDMYYLFNDCKSLNLLDLRNFNTANVTSMNRMFYGCSTLKTIIVDEEQWSTASVTNGKNMFKNCSVLVGGNGTTYSSDHIDHAYACVDKPGQPGYLTDKSTAGINPVIADDNSNKPYYSLDGRKLSGTPTSKGVYIRNGRKVLVKYY